MSVPFEQFLEKKNAFGSGQKSAPVLLPGFAIEWCQNQVTRQGYLRDLTHLKISSAKWRSFCLGLNVLATLFESSCTDKVPISHWWNWVLSVIRNTCDSSWKRFPHYWPSVRGIPRSLVDSPHKGPDQILGLKRTLHRWLNANKT